MSATTLHFSTESTKQPIASLPNLVYIGDVPYLSDGQRVALTITDRSSTIYTVTDPLPHLGPRDYATVSDLRPLGEHLGSDRSRDRARVVSSSVRRGPRDGLVLHTVLVQLPR